MIGHNILHSVARGHVDGDAIYFSSKGGFGRGMEEIHLRSNTIR